MGTLVAIAAPFFALVLVQPRGLRTIALTGAGYVGVTLFAVRFQPRPIFALLEDSMVYGRVIAEKGGYANLHNMLVWLDRGDWALAASFILLGGFTIWVYLHRFADVWILLGVLAVVARLWAYHRVYDDLLIVLPMVTLFRVAKESDRDSPRGRAAELRLAISVIAMLAPARLELLAFPWHLPFTAGHGLLWLAILTFLMASAGPASPGLRGSQMRRFSLM